VAYYIESVSNNGETCFEIDSNNGSISSSCSFDREEFANYQVCILFVSSTLESTFNNLATYYFLYLSLKIVFITHG